MSESSIMSKVVLKNIKKIYPFASAEARKRGKRLAKDPNASMEGVKKTNLQITEENTGQTWTINYPFEATDVIEIDCLTRTVELNPVDPETYGDELNTYVDINSDWFYLNKSYHFTCETAVIQSVRYNQRG